MLGKSQTNGRVVVIAAIGLVVMQAVTAVLDYQREQNKFERDLRAEQAITEIKEAAAKQHDATNSRLDEYKDLMAVSEFAKGVLAGIEQAEKEAAIKAEGAAEGAAEKRDGDKD